ncbi:hypothetical protein EOK75_00615 [Pseudorhodobacter turbinis]|uniref:Uncharacterized protein n=1 Tax=Pseudorhodobacter turbinis TaxID=2500533 RepID=A0A4P8ECF3_9RHOB|nr:hypothetical protein [Pseudorhodobacter turbinis]QCO54452.1 hypothetical protein EOK75_00615 [Pseudorhodobacter turbinis]
MTLKPVEAERLLSNRFGDPAKAPTDYVIGFRTRTGKVLAMHRQASETRIWFQPPTPPEMDGVVLLAVPNNGNSNINGPLSPLARPDTLRVEIDTAAALQRFIDWYGGGSAVEIEDTLPVPRIADFKAIFERFQSLVTARSGHPFETFEDGLAASWESYKPLLRKHALALLAPDSWDEANIGSGSILRHVIDAIEIQKDSRTNLTNNLLFWQNRYGHANREHRILLEALQTPNQTREMERILFDFYRGNADDGATFDRLADMGGKYTLIAYLFFLKDMDRYMPIQPTGFDRAFRAMDIDFSTLRQCSWDNYSTYLAILAALRPLIASEAKLASVRLVDAHSLVWILASLMKLEAAGELAVSGGKASDGRVLGAREKSIIAMRLSVENTVKGSNGQVVERTVKNKELRMSRDELEATIARLLELQGDRCALTGIRLQFHGGNADKNLLPSLDRIDSDGHYEDKNLQVVCQFINFWKGDSDNEAFSDLLMLVRNQVDLRA